ncbi:allophanate hydrolase [Acetobacter tropicalis]|uniref:Allophanate hydrolase n=1 Tax=Acetobacter tropicalis TaxID=104102 RepID=A0A094YS62_9PROT|nr:allophanate hydrolase [Acetobacter tropicalis]KAA8387275.1 allophanate hydrolase [Acetobacter tropicalis]KAA8391045.1 allophanate hydrolase [Acetobacter tropicalis]KGB24885.1 Allophanate hydrolase [Acetobacter tropicalis]MBC9009735.1 allophanate hydrolase [Acetobacter tropicalis]MDO8172509.1 allophanate hydrolase [Acetobacter tropicalis]
MTNNFPNLQIDSLSAAYTRGDITPRDLMAQLKRRSTQLNAEFNLFIHILDEAELDPYLERLENPAAKTKPLYGIPFVIKDNIDLKGVATTAACPAFAYMPKKSATIVEQLIELGALPVGKANLDQFATGLNGTRSPYGICKNSVLPEYPSGGSSAGSALAVALGVASFSLGTDTAGSGRIPAAYNNLVGLKASKGLISTAGVVPACRTLDCTTLFTATAAEASRLLGLVARHDPRDDFSRHNPAWNDATAFGDIEPGFRFGVPKVTEFFGDDESAALFAASITTLKNMGGTEVSLDFNPFLEAARLLYEGPWVAERYLVAGPLITKNPEAVLPVIHDVLEKAPHYSALDHYKALYRLQHLKMACDALMADLDFVITPSMPHPVTLNDLYREPVEANSKLGWYTNFMNLLDYAAVAVPASFMTNGLPWGITLFGRAFTDQYLLSVANKFQHTTKLALVGGHTLPASVGKMRRTSNDRARVVVCGAHLEGLPLNWQLRERQGRLVSATTTSAHYRLYALPGGPPMRPAMVRAREGGQAIEVEVWEVPSAELGSFLTNIPAPLGLGKVELADGSWETGFVCDGYAIADAQEITSWGGWRAWLKSRAP